MRYRFPWLIGLLVLVVVIAGGAPAPVFSADKDQAAGEAALAEKLALLSQSTLRGKSVTNGHWRQSTALLDAAARLAPTEPRFPRFLSESYLHLGQTQAAIDALNAYRKVEPGNSAIQIQVLELHLSQMETTDARLGYLENVYNVESLPPEVRSHAATLAARVQLERARREIADKLLDEALKLNPVNTMALRLKYELLPADASREQRISVALDLLRANPAQPAVINDVAALAADAGLVDDSLYWYGLGLNLTTQSGTAPAPQVVHDYIAELLVSDQRPAADRLIEQWVRANPGDVDAWFLRLAILMHGPEKAAYDQVRSQALTALVNRMAEIRQAAGDTSATTRPVDQPGMVQLPEVAADVERLRAANRPELLDAYTSALSDLVWFELYFNDQRETAGKLLAELKKLLPEQSVTLARLEGWTFLREGKKQEAEQKLNAVAGRDPLAALGLVVLQSGDEATKQAAVERGRELLSNNPSGLIGAILWDALQPMGVRLQPGPAADAIRTKLGEFPRDWLKILELPRNFYLVRGDPLKVSHGFGEPMLARVTVINVGNYDLTIGPDGIIRPDLWFDASLRGVTQQDVPGIAYDRIAKATVLRKGESTSQIVRVDQGDFHAMLSANPTMSVQAFVSVVTNPLTGPQGLTSGPGGSRSQFAKIMERRGTPIGTPEGRQNVVNAVVNGSQEEKIWNLELVATLVGMLRNDPNNEQNVAVEKEFIALLQRGTNDAAPAVRSWASFLLALLSKDDARKQFVTRMAESDLWTSRLLALAATRDLPADDRKALATQLAENDPDPTVKAFAAGIVELGAVAAPDPTAPTTTTAPVAPQGQ